MKFLVQRDSGEKIIHFTHRQFSENVNALNEALHERYIAPYSLARKLCYFLLNAKMRSYKRQSLL